MNKIFIFCLFICCTNLLHAQSDEPINFNKIFLSVENITIDHYHELKNAMPQNLVMDKVCIPAEILTFLYNTDRISKKEGIAILTEFIGKTVPSSRVISRDINDTTFLEICKAKR